MKNKITINTESELMKLLADKREALRKFRFGVSGAKVTNTKEARNLRKDIARVLTKLNTVEYE